MTIGKQDATLQDLRGIDYIVLGLMLVVIALVPQGFIEFLEFVAKASTVAISAVQNAYRFMGRAARRGHASHQVTQGNF